MQQQYTGTKAPCIKVAIPLLLVTVGPDTNRAGFV